MTAEQIRLAMENKLEYLMEVKPQLASDDQLYKAAALVLRDLMVEKRRAHRAKTTAERKKRIHYLSMEFLMGKSLKNSLYNLGLVEPFTEAPRSRQWRPGPPGCLLPGWHGHRWLLRHRLLHPVRVRHL